VRWELSLSFVDIKQRAVIPPDFTRFSWNRTAAKAFMMKLTSRASSISIEPVCITKYTVSSVVER